MSIPGKLAGQALKKVLKETVQPPLAPPPPRTLAAPVPDKPKGPRLAHYLRTQAYIRDPEAVMTVLDDEVGRAFAGATERGNKLGVRLNVLSDIPPENYKALMEKYPDVTFYDYSKLHGNKPIAPNHHMTYSSTGVSQPEIGKVNKHQNWKHMTARMDEGHDITMAFTTDPSEALPKFVHDKASGKTYKVIDGDIHDYRPADKWGRAEGADGVVVGLRNKGLFKGEQAAKENEGFFTYHEPGTDTVTISQQGKITTGTLAGVTLGSAAFLAQYPNFEDYNPELGEELSEQNTVH